MKNPMSKGWARKLPAALIAAAAAVSLVACSGANAGEQNSTDDSKGALAMGFGGLDLVIWNDIVNLMEPMIEDAGYTFLANDPQWDVQKQVTDWDSWIQRGDVKAIMGFPLQADAIIPVTERAQDAGITVLGYAELWEGVDFGTVIDSYTDGQILGTAIGEWVNENKADEAEVPVAVAVDMTTDMGRARSTGIIDALNETSKNVKVFELGGISREEGYNNAKAHLVAVPETEVWVAQNSDLGAGMYQALLDHGVAPDDPNYVIGALDATNETLDIVKTPDTFWRFAYILPAADLARANADLLIQAAEGGVTESIVITSTRVTADTADDYYV